MSQEEFLEKFLALAKSIKLGNPLDPTTEMGPLTSAGHRDRVSVRIDTSRGSRQERAVAKLPSTSPRKTGPRMPRMPTCKSTG